MKNQPCEECLTRIMCKERLSQMIKNRTEKFIEMKKNNPYFNIAIEQQKEYAVYFDMTGFCKILQSYIFDDVNIRYSEKSRLEKTLDIFKNE